MSPADNGGCDDEDSREPLRVRAEKRLAANTELKKIPKKTEDILKLVQELRVHQIELEIQNEELARIREEVDSALERYTDLYDFAPVGHFTLDKNSTILQVNLAGAGMLGTECSAITGRSFQDFVMSESLSSFNDFILSVFKEKGKGSFETEFSLEGLSPLFVHAKAVAGGATGKCLLAVTDITDRKKAELALSESEKKYRVLAESSGDVIFIHDLNYVFSYVNRTYFFPPEMFFEQKRQANEVIATKKSLSEEIEVVPLGDVKVWHNVLLMPLLADDGTVEAIMGSVRDITDRKKAEEELRKSERFSQVAESAEEWIWELDAEGLYTYVSPAVEKILGFLPEEIVGMIHFYDLFAPEESDELKNKAIEQFAGKEPYIGFVIRNIQKNGNTVILETSGVPHLDGEGRLMGYRGVNTDITERMRTQDALRKSEEKFRNLVENISDVIYILDLDGKITYISPAVEKIYGFTQDEIVGNNFSVFVHPEDLPGAIKVFRQRLKGEYHENMLRIYDKKGREHYVRTTMTPIEDKDVVTGFNYIMTDFTERKLAEEALKEANKKLNMLSTITRHDILNMIMVIRGYLEMLEEIRDENLAREYMMKEKEAVNAIQHQIEFTRYYQDIGVGEPGWRDLREIVKDAAKQIDTTGIAIKNSLKGLEIFADPLVGKVFYNLMENSLRHGEHVTLIDISSSKKEDRLVISYRDNGAGITVEDKKKLFRKGFGKNTGLGLFLSREILSITGITIDENGKPGEGVNFAIIVPEGKFRIISSSKGNEPDN